MARALNLKATKAKKPTAKVESTANRLAAFYGNEFDTIDKKTRIVAGLNEQYRISSGNLVFDLIIGGGLVNGWFTFIGPEGSAKSSMVMSIIGQSLKTPFLTRRYYDGENAVHPEYSARVMGVKQLADIFGERNDKGEWIIPPKVRYSDSSVAEATFKNMLSTLNSLPDKLYLAENKQWYLVFANKQKEIARMKAMGLTHDAKLFSKTGRYWCPTDDPNPQALFALDSLPSFIPEDLQDEDDEGNEAKDSAGLGVHARFYSAWIPRVKGKVRRKGCIVLVVNQLRERPMARGNPEYEPCGNAAKFNTDCRNIFRSVYPDAGFPINKDKKDQGKEESVEFEGSSDLYAYKKIANQKNKFGTPTKTGMMRIWMSDGQGNARGICPVYDTWNFLKTTGQIDGTLNRGFTINVEGYDCKAKLKYYDFKLLILAETTKNKAMQARASKQLKVKAFNLRALCFKQVASGKAKQLALEAAKARTTNVDDDME